MAVNIRIQISSSKEYLVPYEVGKSVIFGRSHKADLQLDDPKISGKHLRIELRDGIKVIAKDLDSTNHSYINGSKFEESYVYLGDVITIGRVRLSIDRQSLDSDELKELLKDDATMMKKTRVTHLSVVDDLTFTDENSGDPREKELDFDLESPTGNTQFIRLDKVDLRSKNEGSSKNLKVKRVKARDEKKNSLLSKFFKSDKD